ncbi:RNA polymerase, sigma-24 subunit, ECF subfamily [Kribbella flavida DSM 17836]|uniref:RNA polymerase sigma factor n=1 Tax=Kribbella flavida (strain DSM 17836 / JCM 10339 / NBRC 14399) TaxID=479435 RepID=D2PWJ3_KRIFD|nr:sigma-70 family RNA polymerase sigma factor [Kribbella flavida]ADB33462.1 RNA polymerase, sigma-24 subunit, ECF subfamily [Kribbella flavida DSM 17836]
MTEDAFAEQTERYRHELRVHCYRMLGSYDDAEDLVQETFLRAWRHRADFEGRSSFRAWLYRIATNACLDDLRRPQRVLPYQLEPASWPTDPRPGRDDLPWLQPYPDVLLDRAEEPDAQVIRRETIELAFLTAIQQLPARQRAVVIFRDVLGWPAKDTAELLGTTVASVNSALQRARPVLREHLPPRRTEWAPAGDPSAVEQALLTKYLEAFEAGDAPALAALMHEDVRVTMPPYPFWYAGRDRAEQVFAANFEPGGPANRGAWRFLISGVNRQPALAAYLRVPGDTVFRPFGFDVFRIENGLIAELTAFELTDFPAYGLPGRLT